METGFYWVGDGVREPQVWFWYQGSGFYKPVSSTPITLAELEAAGLKILSEKLTEPEFKRTD
ncbi:hypothetical protein [Pantoea septica]|uniref:hypothetical protein n=1 Tax=Pantoea septica TaxID=472695 RepID=UPI002899344E|nr:hypothetical protein [Pantoea septica]